MLFLQLRPYFILQSTSKPCHTRYLIALSVHIRETTYSVTSPRYLDDEMKTRLASVHKTHERIAAGTPELAQTVAAKLASVEAGDDKEHVRKVWNSKYVKQTNNPPFASKSSLPSTMCECIFLVHLVGFDA
jgi:acetylglutamate synthase